MKVFSDLNQFAAARGSQHGPTEWMEISQERVNLFADATDDHQWIHVDPELAASGPFGATIAHGLLTLSLLPHFSHQLYRVDNVALAVNYGYNKVRFITPVKVGARIRARGEILSSISSRVPCKPARRSPWRSKTLQSRRPSWSRSCGTSPEARLSPRGPLPSARQGLRLAALINPPPMMRR